MSINAMKLALAALETCRIRSVSEWSVEDITPKNVTAAIAAIRTAIQQAEAQQPATGEPVGFVDFQGTVFWHDGPPTADSLLFAAKPVSHDKAKWCEYVAGMVFTWLEMQENLKEEDRCIKAIAGIIERRMWALPTTHPAPSVPDGLQWFTVAEHGLPEVGEVVVGGLWYTDPWLKPECATSFMWGQCRVVDTKHRGFKDGKQWLTFGPSHNQITHWARLNPPAMLAAKDKHEIPQETRCD